MDRQCGFNGRRFLCDQVIDRNANRAMSFSTFISIPENFQRLPSDVQLSEEREADGRDKRKWFGQKRQAVWKAFDAQIHKVICSTKEV